MIEFSIHKYYVDSFQNIKYDLVKDLKMFNNHADKTFTVYRCYEEPGIWKNK